MALLSLFACGGSSGGAAPPVVFDLGVDTNEQADISVARDGSIIVVVTPIILAADPSHQGCMVFSFDDFASASIARDTNGVAIPRAIITADGNSLGAGALYVRCE